jgi:hypothetical protein
VACALCKKSGGTFSIFDNQTLGEKDVVVFDSITQISNSSMNNIGKGEDDDWKPEWYDYRNQGTHLDRFFSTIQNAPWNCVCITHEGAVEFDTDGGAKEKIIPLAGTKNFSKNTAKYFDEIVYCEVRNKRHQAGSSSTFSLNILTGSRSRTAVEDQQKKDITVKNSLLPIFTSQGISGNERATAVLEGIKKRYF